MEFGLDVNGKRGEREMEGLRVVTGQDDGEEEGRRGRERD